MKERQHEENVDLGLLLLLGHGSSGRTSDLMSRRSRVHVPLRAEAYSSPVFCKIAQKFGLASSGSPQNM